MKIARQDIGIRPATAADAGQLAVLIQQLGYGISPRQLQQNLAGLCASEADHVCVATAGSALLGCISLHAMSLLHAAGRLGRITALVVDAEHRGQGIGQTLVQSAHAWFEATGCTRFEVTSADQRVAAHRFYEQHGYARTGQRLARAASPE